jgi:hypothetical protein
MKRWSCTSTATPAPKYKGQGGPEGPPYYFPLQWKNMPRSYKLFLKGYNRQTLKFNEKSVFVTDTVEYLGHICTPLGIRPDPKKVKAIMEYPVPGR